jgi:hypothetical protein
MAADMQFEYTPPQTALEEALGGFRCINAFGKIEQGDDEKFVEFLGKSEVPPRTDMYISSSGGDVDTSITIGRTIRSAWLSTHVGSYTLDGSVHDNHLRQRVFEDGKCMSAATLMYLGGRLRYLSKGAKFGVHQFSFRDPSPANVARSQILSARIARYVADMGVSLEFLEISASAPGDGISVISIQDLDNLGVVTGGQTSVSWSLQSIGGTIYVRGERDSMFGHHKIIFGYLKHRGFYLLAVIESQGREAELTGFPLVELDVANSTGAIIDISHRCHRQINGIYTNITCQLSNAEASALAYSDGFGVRVRGGPDAGMFLGIAPMSSASGREMLRSYFEAMVR